MKKIEHIGRQPVHVVYGGAQLFKSNSIARIGEISLNYFDEYLHDNAKFASVFELERRDTTDKVFDKVRVKLLNEPVEDYRIDFEDGFGYRSDKEEDETAIKCAREAGAAFFYGKLPYTFGIRVKPFSGEFRERSYRTLLIFLTEFLRCTSGKLPPNFMITLPKVNSPREVSRFIVLLTEFEKEHSLNEGSLKLEIMVETAETLISKDGSFALPAIVSSGGSRIVAAHFGAFDYLAELGVTAKYQTLLHQSCDFARNIMKVSLEGSGIRLSDGATNIIPLPVHKGNELSDDERKENNTAVCRAWKIHFDNVSHSLRNGFYQGWDLHPAQLIPRYSATYLFFQENLEDTTLRLKNFLEQAARSTTHANVFDDAASGLGLLNFFIRAYNCGAITEAEVNNAGLTLDELNMKSFSKIIENRNSK